MGDFARLMGALDYPMFVVTAAAGDEVAGCLVGFATQSSIDPPRFLVCISKANHTFDVACRSTHLAVHVLDRNDRQLAAHFGSQTGDEVDKFEDVSWTRGPGGVPVLDDLDRHFVGEVLDRFDAGDHVAHLLAPVEASPATPDEPLMFHDVKDLEPGHPAQNHNGQQ